MPSWLEQELERGLAPVRAPHVLWTRIQTGPPKRRSRTAWPWAAVGSLAAAALAFAFSLSSPDLTHMAAARLAAHRPPDFQSTSPREISRWLRDRAGLDVGLPDSTRAQLRGACVVKRGSDTYGEVLYSVDGRDAILLVSRKAKSEAPHRDGEFTWSARGQAYALAFAGPADSHLPCRLCHLD